ncbi:MAG TPA: thiamine pyrophosphate-requiring protein [Stellaceae bacterium]|jgi:acetolactate synthase-1/2/3 large subunit|nr:thiamine pyrophosphate-requiring protein [Stellaceae bacterium]
MAREQLPVESVAEAYLALLADRGIEYLFANAGTDFAPIVEAYARATHSGLAAPKPLLATHENLAMSMAHGYAATSGRVPAVMVHVSVGTANALCGVFNAARENVPILFTAGRSPLTEDGMIGARDTYIHWAQEMFDQAGMLREMVKWEYELRNGPQLETVVDRALTIATSPPHGPVYLSLPREVLAAPLPDFAYDSPSRRVAASPPAPDEAAVAEAAKLLAVAKHPLIITADAGRDREAVPVLAEFAERFAIPLVEHRQRHLSLPADHPCHLGYNPAALLDLADAILVIDCDVPWTPSRKAPSPGCKIIHIAVDPLFSRYPIRGFPADIAITGATRLVLPRLGMVLAPLADETAVAARRQNIVKHHAAQQAALAEQRRAVAAMRPIHPVHVSACLAQARDPASIIVNEYTLLPEHCPSTRAGSFFGSSPAAGLGWGAGAALGVKLAEPDRQVIAVLGDGSYLFSNPVAVHHASTLHRLPVLFIVVNNAMWGAVRRATLGMYPQGEAARSNRPPFIDLDDLPAFEQVCAAAGGYGERVEDPAELPAALKRALHAVNVEKRQALLNVICQGGGGG